MINDIANALKYVFGARPVVRHELAGKNETFQHLPGKLHIQLNLTAAREQEFIKRKTAIDTACQAACGAALRAHDAIMSQANGVRDAALQTAEATKRRDMRALYIDFNTIGDEPAPKPVQIDAAKNGADDARKRAMESLATGPNGAEKVQTRRRIATVAKVADGTPAPMPPLGGMTAAEAEQAAVALDRQRSAGPNETLV